MCFLVLFFLNVGFHVSFEASLIQIILRAEKALVPWSVFFLHVCDHVPFESLLHSESPETDSTLERIWISVDVNVI